MLLKFKEKYRTAEFHKFSSIRAFTTKNQWDHLQKEERLISEIIDDLQSYFLTKKIQ